MPHCPVIGIAWWLKSLCEWAKKTSCELLAKEAGTFETKFKISSKDIVNCQDMSRFKFRTLSLHTTSLENLFTICLSIKPNAPSSTKLPSRHLSSIDHIPSHWICTSVSTFPLPFMKFLVSISYLNLHIVQVWTCLNQVTGYSLHIQKAVLGPLHAHEVALLPYPGPHTTERWKASNHVGFFQETAPLSRRNVM